MQNNFNILFVGDVIGSSGMRAIFLLLPRLIKKYKVDFVIVNAENANEGFGLNKKIVENLFNAGVQVITTGNHIWQNYEENEYLLKKEKRLLVPANYSVDLHKYYKEKVGELQIVVVNLQGRVRMAEIDCPFKLADKLLKMLPKDALIVVDFHADCVFEKESLANYLDGRVLAVLGTHTHIQTNDFRILKKGTAYITDVGATAPENGVIGFNYELVLKRFLHQIPYKNEVLTGVATLNGVLLKINKKNRIMEGIIPIKELAF